MDRVQLSEGKFTLDNLECGLFVTLLGGKGHSVTDVIFVLQMGGSTDCDQVTRSYNDNAISNRLSFFHTVGRQKKLSLSFIFAQEFPYKATIYRIHTRRRFVH